MLDKNNITTMAKREILFRGWNKKNKRWLYGYYVVNGGEHLISPGAFVNDLEFYEDYVVEADTVGQYTGLKDKKGKKIFEGDILNVDFLNGTRTVSYCKDGFVCEAANTVSYDLHNVYKDCCVIGNAHQNQ